MYVMTTLTFMLFGHQVRDIKAWLKNCKRIEHMFNEVHQICGA